MVVISNLLPCFHARKQNGVLHQGLRGPVIRERWQVPPHRGHHGEEARAGFEPAKPSATAPKPSTSTGEKAAPVSCSASSAAAGKDGSRCSSSRRNGAAATGAAVCASSTCPPSSAPATNGGPPSAPSEGLATSPAALFTPGLPVEGIAPIQTKRKDWRPVETCAPGDLPKGAFSFRPSVAAQRRIGTKRLATATAHRHCSSTTSRVGAQVSGRGEGRTCALQAHWAPPAG